MGTWRMYPVSMAAASPLLMGDSGLLQAASASTRARSPPRLRPTRSCRSRFCCHRPTALQPETLAH